MVVCVVTEKLLVAECVSYCVNHCTLGSRVLCLAVVLLAACMSVCKHISVTTGPKFISSLFMLPSAMAQSSFSGIAICYVLPVSG